MVQAHRAVALRPAQVSVRLRLRFSAAEATISALMPVDRRFARTAQIIVFDQQTPDTGPAGPDSAVIAMRPLALSAQHIGSTQLAAPARPRCVSSR